MKTISGSILASKQITLSKAASNMNNFVSTETGASTAVSSYLRRCAAAFKELVQDHKELKTGRFVRIHKHKKTSLENANVAAAEENNHKEEENNNLEVVVERRRTDLGEEEVESVRYSENSGLGSIDEEEKTTMETVMKKTKTAKKKKRNKIDEIEIENAGIEVEEEIKEEKKKKKRKKPLDDSEERHTMKKRRKHEKETY